MKWSCKEEEGGRSRQRESLRHRRAWDVPETERKLLWLEVGERVGKRLEKRWEEGGGAGPNGQRFDSTVNITGSWQEVR